MRRPSRRSASGSGSAAESAAAAQVAAIEDPAAPQTGVASGARSPVRQVEIGVEEQGQRLDKTLAQLLPGVPRSRLFRLIRRGEVRVNGHRAGPEQRLVAGDRVRLPPVHAAAAGVSAVVRGVPGSAGSTQSVARRGVPAGLLRAVEAAIIHADERLLVLDKPAGLAVHGGSGLSFGVIEVLRASRPEETLELAHRLDRDTSGILLVARRRSALRMLHALLREGEVRKSYLALVAGRWQLGHRHIDAPLRTDLRVGGERMVRVARSGGVGGRGGTIARGTDEAAKPALTEFRLIEHYGARASLLEATLHTGRMHQIRVHAAHAGHPIAGDDKYGDRSLNAELRTLGLARMFLHAHACSFVWPDSGVEQSFSAPLPAELRAVLDRLAADGSVARRAAAAAATQDHQPPGQQRQRR
jgi:23S rRNA pseudouridine955/2504/2580 synthase